VTDRQTRREKAAEARAELRETREKVQDARVSLQAARADFADARARVKAAGATLEDKLAFLLASTDRILEALNKLKDRVEGSDLDNKDDVLAEIDEAIEYAKALPFPDHEQLLEHIYAP